MIKLKILALAILILLFAFRMWQTTGCRQFKSFRFNPLAIIIGVEAGVSSDKGVNRTISRFFHNKVSVGTYEVLNSFVDTFSPNFFLELFGPIGVVIAFSTLQTSVINKRKLELLSLAIIIIFSALALFIFNPKTAFYLLAISWYAFILLSAFSFLRNKLLLLILIFLALFTFWYFTFSWQLPAICHEIFFN